MLLRHNLGPEPELAMMLAPLPSPSLAKRFTETKVPPHIVRAIIHGKDSERLLKRGHVLVSDNTGACIMLPSTPVHLALDIMESYAGHV